MWGRLGCLLFRRKIAVCLLASLLILQLTLSFLFLFLPCFCILATDELNAKSLVIAQNGDPYSLTVGEAALQGVQIYQGKKKAAEKENNTTTTITTTTNITTTTTTTVANTPQHSPSPDLVHRHQCRKRQRDTIPTAS